MQFSPAPRIAHTKLAILRFATYNNFFWHALSPIFTILPLIHI